MRSHLEMKRAEDVFISPWSRCGRGFFCRSLFQPLFMDPYLIHAAYRAGSFLVVIEKDALDPPSFQPRIAKFTPLDDGDTLGYWEMNLAIRSWKLVGSR